MSIDFDENEYTAGIIEPETKKKGSLLKGIGVGLVITVIFELGVGLALDAQSNLVHRYIAYLLGFIPIIVAAFMTRSTLKMFFIGAPVLILSSFALPYFLPDIFSGLMTPFLNVVPVLNALIDSLNNFGLSDPGIQEVQVLINQFGIVLDLFFGIIVGVMAAIGFSGIAKIVTKKPGVLTILTFLISMVIILIFVILLPYVLIVFSGASQFVLTFGAGGIYLSEGINVAQTDSDAANDLFAESEIWFDEAESMMRGLESMGLFLILGSADPNVKIIVDNGLKLVNAAVDLAQGIVPAMSGITAVQEGMSQSMGDLTTQSNNLQLMLDQTDEFDSGIEKIEEGFADFTRAIDEIKQALDNIREMDEEELKTAFESLGAGDVGSQLDVMFAAVELFDATLSVFSNEAGTGLMDDPDGIEVDTERSAIVNLLLGAQAMSDAQEQIGESSSFENTGGNFNTMINHLSLVTPTLDETNNPAIADLLALDLNASAEVQGLRDQIVGTINFMRDVSNIVIAIGEFGLVASPTLNAMNQTMSIFDPETNGGREFNELTVEEYDTAITSFDSPSGIIANTTIMINIANNTIDGVETQIAAMSTRVDNEEYGFFADPAAQFVTEFQSFDLTQNAANFFFLSSGFSAVVKAMKALNFVDQNIDYIKTNITIIEDEIAEADTDGDVSAGDLANLTLAVDNILLNYNSTTEPSLETAIIEAEGHMQHAGNNFTRGSINETMPQLAATGEAFIAISGILTEMVNGNTTRGGLSGPGGIGEIIQSISDGINSDALSYFSPLGSSAAEADLANLDLELQYQSDKMDEISAELGNVSISGDS